MRRRDFLRVAAVGACSITAVAHASRGDGLRAVPIARAGVGAGTSLDLEVTASALRDATVTRRRVDALDYLRDFGMTTSDLGITDARVSIVSTPFEGALAELIDLDDHCVVIWDGVAYRVEAA